MRKKNSKLGIFLLAVSLGLIGLSLFVILSETRVLQYIVPAADIALDSTDDEGALHTTLQDRREALRDEELAATLAEGLESYTLSAHAPSVPIAVDEENGNSALAGLVGAGEQYFVVYPKVPLLGRLINPDELELGDKVILLDEQLAIELFQMADVIDREVRINEQTYRVVGVLRHGRQVGDDADYYCYVPYRALEKRTGLQLQTLRLSAVPQPRGGAMKTFEAASEEWLPGGQAYDLGKERTGAWIWARYLACGLGFAIWGMLVGAYIRWVQQLFARYREKISRKYIGSVLPWLILQILLRLIGLLLLAGMVGGLMLLLLQPVNSFPEYVPQILVEPREIQKTFWNLRAAESRQIVYQSAEVIRLTYFAGVIKSAVVIFLAGLAMCIFRRRREG